MGWFDSHEVHGSQGLIEVSYVEYGQHDNVGIIDLLSETFLKLFERLRFVIKKKIPQIFCVFEVVVESLGMEFRIHWPQTGISTLNFNSNRFYGLWPNNFPS